MKLLSRLQATAAIRREALTSSRIQLTRHVRERMMERGINLRQVVEALKVGMVVDDGHLSIHGDPVYRVLGRGLGDTICVVVAINHDGLIVVTTFDDNG